MSDQDKNTSRAGSMFDMPLGQFIGSVGNKQPTPGGGSVAAVAGALGAALGQMSLNYSIGKKSLVAFGDEHERLKGRFAKTLIMLQQLMGDDIEAFGLYNEALALPAGAEKDASIQLSLAACINVPRELAGVCLILLDDIYRLAGACTKWLMSDVMAAGAMAVAAVRMCDYNVRINVGSLDDAVAGRELSTASSADVRKSEVLLGAIEHLAGKGM